MSGEEKKTFREALSQADDNGTTLPARWTTRSSPKEINAQAERMEDYMARVHEFSREEHEAFKDLDDTFSSLEEEVALGSITPRPYKSAFWAYEETDPDYLSAEDMDADDFTENDIMSMAHGKLEEHREFREYARIAAWQMPLLSSKPMT